MKYSHHFSKILGYMGHIVVKGPSRRNNNISIKSTNRKASKNPEANRLAKHKRRMECGQC